MAKKEVKEIKALSPTEQMVYSVSFTKRIVSTSDVKEILGDSHKSADYVTAPPNLVGKEVKPDKFLVGNKVKEDYYFSYHSIQLKTNFG